MSTTKQKKLSDEHLASLDVGRKQRRIIIAYLTALKTDKPKRGRKRSAQTVSTQLADAQADLELALKSGDVIKEVLSIQRITDLERELSKLSGDDANDLGRLTAEFITVAAGYSQRKGIDRATWRKAGVPAKVLDDAGIK